MRFHNVIFGIVLLSATAAAQPQPYVISSVAGGSILPATPMAAVNTGIGSPVAIAADTAGNVYFASAGFYAIFKMDPAGILTHVAGTGRQGFSGDGGPAAGAQLTSPSALALDPAGDLYIADGFSGRVRKVSPNGIISTIAGSGVGCCWNNGAGDGGPATAAQLYFPYQVAADADGNVYIGEWNTSRIRRVSPDGIITTVVGIGTAGYSGDGGPANAAKIGAPWGLTFDRAGNLYFSDAIPGDDIEPTSTHIRKVSPDGIITTVAGSGGIGYGGDGGPAANAQFDEPGQLAVDGSGNVYVPDGARIRKISADGIVTTIAGDGKWGYSGDGGPAVGAEVTSSVYGQGLALAADAAGNLYLADSGNNRVRKISPDGIIATVAGNGGSCCYSSDGGAANSAYLNIPVGVAAAADGAIYIADTYNQRVRKVSPDGIIATLAGDISGGPLGDGGPAAAGRLALPAGLALDPAGNLYIADSGNHRVRKISTAGTISTVAGNGNNGFSGDGGPAIGAQLDWPKDVALDGAGNLYIADTVNNRIRKVTPDGTVSTVAGTGASPYSGDGGPALGAGLNMPSGVAVDAAGNLYIADTYHYRVRKVTPGGTITTVAGNGIVGYSGDGGPATAARLSYPAGVKVDTGGNLYIGDYSSVRMVSPDGIITTVAGNGTLGYSGDGGPATAAQTGAWGLALGPAGQIYVADPWNNVVRLLATAH